MYDQCIKLLISTFTSITQQFPLKMIDCFQIVVYIMNKNEQLFVKINQLYEQRIAPKIHNIKVIIGAFTSRPFFTFTYTINPKNCTFPLHRHNFNAIETTNGICNVYMKFAKRIMRGWQVWYIFRQLSKGSLSMMRSDVMGSVTSAVLFIVSCNIEGFSLLIIIIIIMRFPIRSVTFLSTSTFPHYIYVPGVAGAIVANQTNLQLS